MIRMRALLDRASAPFLALWNGTSREPSYDDVRAEMGGAAWREVPKSTDAWFVPDDAHQEGTPDFAGRAHRRRSLIAYLIVGSAATLVLGMVLVASRSHARTEHASAAAVSAAAVSAPFPTAALTPTASGSTAAVGQTSPARGSALQRHHAQGHVSTHRLKKHKERGPAHPPSVR